MKVSAKFKKVEVNYLSSQDGAVKVKDKVECAIVNHKLQGSEVQK